MTRLALTTILFAGFITLGNKVTSPLHDFVWWAAALVSVTSVIYLTFRRAR
jgi:hypothetical protein